KQYSELSVQTDRKRSRLFGNLNRDSAPRLETPIERVVERVTLILYLRMNEVGRLSANVGGTAGVISSLRNRNVFEGFFFALTEEFR
ncbi:MAG: hypothetical protein FWF22_11050, partial [Treponema sp.]|nr:hypothetical protein [Treponema sp.]